MSVTTLNTTLLTHMPARHAAGFSPLTLLASCLTVAGLLIGALEIRWSLQLVSLACVYSGALLATLGLMVHVLRRSNAWAADGGLLLALAALVWSSPLLPATLQDYLEYLLP